MAKRTPFLFFIILIVSTMPLPRADALGIGPPYLELDLLPDGSNSTMVYVTSNGLSGELIVGREDLPFRVEPSRVNMTSSDVNVPVELTFYGNGTLEPGVYIGLVTFYADTGGFIGYRIRIWATINLLAEAQVQEDEEEPEIEEEPETGTDISIQFITEPESEEEPETIAEEEEPEEEEPEIESEEEPEDESQDSSGNPFAIGALAVGSLVAFGLIGIWWKKR